MDQKRNLYGSKKEYAQMNDKEAWQWFQRIRILTILQLVKFSELFQVQRISKLFIDFFLVGFKFIIAIILLIGISHEHKSFELFNF